MKVKSIKIITLILIIVNAGCNMKNHNTKEKIESIYDNSAIVLFKARPSAATMYGVEQRLAGGKYNRVLDDYSPIGEKNLRENMLNFSQQFKVIEDSGDNTAVMQNITRYFAGNKNFDVGYIDPWMGMSAFIVNQINGPLVDVPNAMVVNQQIKSVEDAND